MVARAQEYVSNATLLLLSNAGTGKLPDSLRPHPSAQEHAHLVLRGWQGHGSDSEQRLQLCHPLGN